MAMARPLRNQKQRLPFFLSEGIFASNIATEIMSQGSAIQGVQGHGNGSNSSVGGFEDVPRLCIQGRLKEALHALYDMDQQCIRRDSYMYDSLLQACLNRKALPEGKLVHAHMLQTGFNPDTYLGTKLVIMYAKCGSLVDARRALDEMSERNVVSWTAMISAYARHGHAQEALALFSQMQRTGIQPNEFALASVLPACASLEALEHGKEVHEAIIRGGFHSNVVVESALVDMYVKCGSIPDARHVFDKMSQRNVVSWTAMIAGYAQNGYFREALKLFQKMPERNVVSWTVMIAGYAQNGQVDEALKLFWQIPEQNVVSWTAMIVGYAQNGYIDEARNFFQQMPERNVISWTAMITGYAQNGYFDEALKLFQQMQLTGVKRNPDTFAGVLPACANLAALHEGRKVHKDVIKSGFLYDIFVGNALVDMYAKCGIIEDAHYVFDQMPRRDVVSWTAMIVGYAMHGCGQEALQLFIQMQHCGTKPDRVTFVGVLLACCHAGLVDDGWQYFDCMIQQYHLTPAMEHYCCIVDLLGRAGRLDEAEDFINKMPIKPDLAVWETLLGACKIHANIDLGERAAKHLFESDPKNAAHYVVLSNIYAAAGRWDGVEKVRKLMKDRKVQKIAGCSWIEVNNKVYTFMGGNKNSQIHSIYGELERLAGQMKEAGYVPDKNFALHDVEEEQKEHILCHHSEKLAIAFGLINTSLGTPIRIVKNLRVCGDCHSAIKFISKIVAREIVVRDANRFHHFKDGLCSCGDYW